MKTLIILAALLILIPQQALCQTEMSKPEGVGIPEFFYDIINVKSNQPGLSRLNLYIEIPYDELQFLKYDDAFQAKYEVSVVIFDKEGDQVDGKIWQEEVTVDNYEATNSRKDYSFTHNSFHLKPKEYRLSIGLMDLDTKKTGNRKSTFQLRDFEEKDLAISDITLTDNVSSDSLGVKSIHPQISSCIRAIGTELFCYFEIYTQDPAAEKFDISYRIKNYKGDVISKQEYQREIDGSRTMEYFKIDKKNLSHGKYLVELEVRQGKWKDSIEQSFTVRWAGMPSTIADLSIAIEQLRYIATSTDIKKIKKAPKSDRLKLFEEFWHGKDPTPGTEANELMDEYYRRIAFSNENFSTFREGWKNDMGMIYIIFGPPSDIERHPFERGYKPFEIWYYYHINRQFIFQDETGFGEYRLINPSWRDWHDGIYF